MKKILSRILKPSQPQQTTPITPETLLECFKLDKKYRWYDGEVEWQGDTARVILHLDKESRDASHQLEQLKTILENQTQWDHRIRQYAADELIDLANDWMESDGIVISKEEFMQRIGVPDIDIEPDRSSEFSYGDDDIFAGHWIVVEVNELGEPVAADIEG